jgi:hypothetical protein
MRMDANRPTVLVDEDTRPAATSTQGGLHGASGEPEIAVR